MKARIKRSIAVLLTAVMVLAMAFQSFAAPRSYTKPAAESGTEKITGTWSKDAAGNWSFNSQDGAARDGWYYLNTTNKATDYNWFCFDANGVMRTGWVQDKNDPSIWYYTGESKDSSEGGLMRGWITDPQDGKRYYLDPSTGIMCHGWQQIGGLWYYFGERQYADRSWNPDATGYWTAGGTGSHSYGSLYVNEYTPDGYYVGSTGAWQQNTGSGNSGNNKPTPKPITKTITDILPTNVRTEMENGWKNEKGVSLYKENSYSQLIFNYGIADYVSLNAPLTSKGNNYTAQTISGATVTFIMNGGVVTSIEFSNPKDTDYSDFVGTYTAQSSETKTIAEILPTEFPTSADSAWVNADGKKAYKEGDDIKIGNLTLGADTTVTKSGDNYVCKSGDATVTFTTNNGAVESITVSGSTDSNGTYTAPAAATYTVTFNMQGHGTQIDPIIGVISGSTITKPTNPTAAGLIFKGWYKESTCDTAWDFSTDTVTGNTTLYAKWAATIGYVIGENFPTQDNAWTNGENCICCYNPIAWAMMPALCFNNTVAEGSITLPCYYEVAETEGGYIYQDNTNKTTLTFNMNGATLESITLNANEAATDPVKTLIGTYTASETKTITDILPTGFPTSADSAWVNAGGKKAYKDGTNIKVGNLTLSEDATVTKSGDNYVCKSGDATVTFNVKDGAVESITVTGSVNSDGTYISKAGFIFKAVYDTNDGANTLTFYYDNVDHSGTNITVYDNLPTAASDVSDWGYKSENENIKSVIIDSSVAYYDGLTSTHAMFYDMTSAISINGAEYLNVDNVTDMQIMFYGYGKNSKDLAFTLDLSKWNISKVTTATGMFNNAGISAGTGGGIGAWEVTIPATTKLAKDGTRKANATNRWYLSDGNPASSILPASGKAFTLAPAGPSFKAVYDTTDEANVLTFYYDDVDHSGTNITVYDNLPTAAGAASYWGYNSVRTNIKEVIIDSSVNSYDELTSTKGMFSNMTNAISIKGAEHLNVDNVTDMTDMFSSFGQEVDIDVVPDVSGWNTDNVTNMYHMFYYYGYNSTELSEVPNVSGWNTDNVTKMQGVFWGYGNTSAKLSTVPDVSGWNTKNATDISYMFYGYAPNSENLMFTLDLSNWDIGEVNSCGSMFNDAGAGTKQTWSVIIPAATALKAGGKINNTEKQWYINDGTHFISPATDRSFTLALAPKKLAMSRPQAIGSIIGDSIPELASPSDAIYDAWEYDGSAWCYIFGDEENAGEKFLVFDDLINSISISLKKLATKVQDEDLLENEEIYKHESADYIIYFYLIDGDLDSIEFESKKDAFSSYGGIYRVSETILEEIEIEGTEEDIELDNDMDIQGEEPEKENDTPESEVTEIAAEVKREEIVEENKEVIQEEQSQPPVSEEEMKQSVPEEEVNQEEIEKEAE